ncbi:hypothetical protein [Prosthecobacter sp.]|jgi:hypothetical protein|uniref:hypothetical protein n=1 Tax=Prosthecobacter sp. TaxID=1965333 RepID=UPI0025E2D20E|nr:hypothetical protein [Prosthecobacter sp.]
MPLLSMLAAATASPSHNGMIVLFPAAFAALWYFVSTVLSHMGGWHRLAQRFRAVRPPAGRRFWMQSMVLGSVSYNGCLTMHASKEGLHLAVWLPFRIAHPPLFLPWSEFRNAILRRSLWVKWIELDIGEPPVAKLRLPLKVLQGREHLIGLEG